MTQKYLLAQLDVGRGEFDHEAEAAVEGRVQRGHQVGRQDHDLWVRTRGCE
jgi:hypothetical protein